jgi:hypothetical protein
MIAVAVFTLAEFIIDLRVDPGVNWKKPALISKIFVFLHMAGSFFRSFLIQASWTTFRVLP